MGNGYRVVKLTWREKCYCTHIISARHAVKYLSGAVLKGSLDHRHDEGKGGGIYEVHKLGLQQCLEAGGRIFCWVLQRCQQHWYNCCHHK